jgi:ADP-heptose:LPS heptosyltransferase
VADFADTAAVIAGLDAVVSVDTSVVHLAGLVGKPAFLLDRYDNCWRWLHGRSDTPWYPRLRIVRQEQPGDWSVPMARIAAALDARSVFSDFVADPT